MLRSFSLYEFWSYLFNGKRKDAQIVNFLKPSVYIHVNHNHYNLLKCDWWSNFFIFRELFCRVVIGQCDWTVGCKLTPVIRQLKQPIVFLFWPRFASSNKSAGKDSFFFYELILPSATFFFSFATSFFNFYYSFYPCTILLSISTFFKTCALFSICDFLLYFLVDCQVTIKKGSSVVVLFRSHVDLCFPFHWTVIVFYLIIFQHCICWPLC